MAYTPADYNRAFAIGVVINTATALLFLSCRVGSLRRVLRNLEVSNPLLIVTPGPGIIGLWPGCNAVAVIQQHIDVGHDCFCGAVKKVFVLLLGLF
jgi:hypothetical protein